MPPSTYQWCVSVPLPSSWALSTQSFLCFLVPPMTVAVPCRGTASGSSAELVIAVQEAGKVELSKFAWVGRKPELRIIYDLQV